MWAFFFENRNERFAVFRYKIACLVKYGKWHNMHFGDLIMHICAFWIVTLCAYYIYQICIFSVYFLFITSATRAVLPVPFNHNYVRILANVILLIKLNTQLRPEKDYKTLFLNKGPQ